MLSDGARRGVIRMHSKLCVLHMISERNIHIHTNITTTRKYIEGIEALVLLVEVTKSSTSFMYQ
jgi:hypothetical protein